MVMKESGEICRDLFLDRPLICVPPYYCKKSAGELTGKQKNFMWCKCAFKTDGKIRTAFAFRTIDGISGNLSYGSRCV